MDLLKKLRKYLYNKAIDSEDRWITCESCGCITDLLQSNRPIQQHYTDCSKIIDHRFAKYFTVERPNDY